MTIPLTSICRPGISDEETQLIRQTAVKAFKALGCRGLARVDFFLLPDGQLCAQ